MMLLPWGCVLLLLVQSESPWIDLSEGEQFSAWREPVGAWYRTDEVTLKASNPKLLEGKGSAGPILVNSPTGKTKNLITKANFRDVEFSCEFLMAEKSNSGVKFNGMYEIQFLDSFGKPVSELTGSDCGGVYPRGESLPKYHTIDQGSPPRVNACRKPGEWQQLHVIFLAPRFDGEGKKVHNARFVKVELNGQVVQENVDQPYPTGSAWRKVKEIPEGPILLQGDHGPVAFRAIKVRSWKGTESGSQR